MAKPEKQKSAGVACLIDGVLTKRVQTLGVSVDITREQIQELANEGVVEYISDSPSVGITIDTNDVGSTDTLALVTDQMLTYGVEDPADGPLGGRYRFYVQAASSNATYRTITQSEMLNGYCGILATLNEDGVSAKRTMWMNRCAITGLSLSYDVNGNAAENYTLSADNKTWFLNEYAGVRCFKPVFRQIASTPDGVKFVGLSSCVPYGSTVVAIGYNNTILRNRDIGGVSGNATMYWHDAGEDTAVATATGITFDHSTVAGSTDRFWIIYKGEDAGTVSTWESQADSADPGWELESSAGAVGALRRGNIKAYLWNTGTDTKSTYTAAGKALRLQTVSIDVALGEDQLFELGNDGFYAISKQTPVPITVTVTSNDSDLEYFAALTSTAYANTAVQTLTIEDFNGYNSLKVEVYKDKAQNILLKTIDIDQMYVQNENFNVSVGDNASHEMTFTTDNISIVGSGTNITGGSNNVA